MPRKRGRTALESSPSQASTSALTLENSSSYASSHDSAPSSENKQYSSPFKRIWNSVNPFKRQKVDSVTKSDGTLLLASSATPNAVTTPSASSSSTSTALLLEDEAMPPTNGLVDLTPIKNGSSSKAALALILASELLASQEGAIRDPLARTHANTSSMNSDPITDTRSSSEEAAEMQIQHTTPPSSPESSADKKEEVEAPDAGNFADVDTEAVDGATEEASQSVAMPAINPETEDSESTSVAADAEPELDHEPETEHKSETKHEPNEEHKLEQHGEKQDENAAENEAEDAKEPQGSAEEAAVEEDEMLVSNSQNREAATEDQMMMSNSQTEEPAAGDEMSISHSQSQKDDNDVSSSNDDPGPLPTDEDVEHIQMIAGVKVGEHVEGLLDWAGSLSTEEQHPPSTPSSEAGDGSDTEPIFAAALPSDTAAEVVDLISDSEDESDSGQDPDKENDGSLVNATPRLDSDATLPSIGSQTPLQQSSLGSRPRGSLVGPLAQKTSQKPQERASGAAHSWSLPTANGLDSGDISATEQIGAIGRQTRFFQPSRGRHHVPQNSTPMHSQPPPPSQNRSSSFSSDISVISIANTSSARHGTEYCKRDPIFITKHKNDVAGYNERSVKRSVSIAIKKIELARRKINAIRKSHRKVPLEMETFDLLADKAIKVHRLIAVENKTVEPIDKFVEKITRRLTMQRKDAEMGVLPLPKAKMVERERLAREQRAREKRLRGVLGRPVLPPTLTEEQERAVAMILKKPGKIAEIPGAEVNDHDVQKLLPRQWLNDEVINFYGNLILLRANDAEKKRTEAMAAAKNAPPAPAPEAASNKKNGNKNKVIRPYDKSLDAFWRVHFFSSFFWPNLKQRGFDGVKRWTRRIDIFSKDIILFPINLGNSHWVCGAINMRKHRFEYYDSMGAPNKSAFNLMRTYITAEAKDKQRKEIDLRGWRDVFSDESPQQENGFDCGVFAAQTLEQISRRDPHTPIPLEAPVIQWKGESLDEGAGRLRIGGGGSGDDHDEEDDWDYEWNFGQENMPYLRRRMAYEIYSKKLLD